jgi:membrane protease YdiL (CAAX protease family)
MEKINSKRILIFLVVAFGISWITGLLIYLTGGLENSPTFDLAGAQISLALILLATAYMFGPAVANVITRLITKEGTENLFLQPHFGEKRWVYYLAAWFLPGLLTILGMILFFILFPRYFDSNLSTLIDMLEETGQAGTINPWLITALQTLQALLISPLLNAISTFGEEFGWRGYLQPKLMPLGSRKALLLTGVIWGIWHWPVILMGYNYGKAYFGAPFLGPLAMVLFTLSLSVIFGWLTIKAESVWPAVIAHGALNGIASLGVIFVKGTPDPLLGPTPVGIIAGLGLSLAAIVLLILPGSLKPSKN